jgi:MFS family permease
MIPPSPRFATLLKEGKKGYLRPAMPPRIKIISSYFASFPLSDRATLVYDGRSGFWSGVINGLALPLVGVVGRKLGMSTGMLAILMGSQFLGLFLNLWFGHLSRSGDLVAHVFWPALVSRGALALVALFASRGAFLAIMCLYFVVSSFGGPAYSSLMRSNYSNGHRARAMGHVRIMMMAVSALCAAFAGAFLQAWPQGFRILFPAAAAAGIAGSLMFRKVRPRRRREWESNGKAESFRASLGLILGDRLFLAYMAIYFIIGFPDKILIPLEPVRLVEELGAGYGAAGFILGTVPLAAAVLGYFICSRLADRTDPFLLLLVTALLSSTRFLGFALATAPAHLIPGSFLNGMANAGWDLLPLFTILLFADQARVGLYMGMHSTLIGLRGLVGPALGSWLYEAGGMRIVDIYWLAFGLEIAGALLLGLFWASLRRAGIFRAAAT